jgi:acyl carrier protein
MNEKILQILAEVSGTDAESIKENTCLADDLGLTSFDLADVVVSIEDEYGVSIPDEVFQTLHTVGDVFAAAKKVLNDA